MSKLIEFNSPQFTEIEKMSYRLINFLHQNDIEKAKETALSIAELAKKESVIKDKWRDLLFEMANKF